MTHKPTCQLLVFAVLVTFFLTLVDQPLVTYAQADNARCDLQNITEAGTRLKLDAPDSAPLRQKVTIQADINTSIFGDYQQYESLRLCIRDSKSRNWSEKPANFIIRTFQFAFSYKWDTQEAESNQSTAENPHVIRIIAIPSSLFGINKPIYYKQRTVILTKTPPGGDDRGGGIIISPTPPGPGGGDESGGDKDPGGGNGGDTKDDTGTVSRPPQFGSDKLREFLVGLVSPKSAEEFVIAVIEFLFSMLAFAAFIAFLVGGIQYMTSLGNEEKAVTGKRTLVYAVVGLVISLSFVAILSIISGQLKEFFQ